MWLRLSISGLAYVECTELNLRRNRCGQCCHMKKVSDIIMTLAALILALGSSTLSNLYNFYDVLRWWICPKFTQKSVSNKINFLKQITVKIRQLPHYFLEHTDRYFCLLFLLDSFGKIITSMLSFLRRLVSLILHF